MAVVKKNTLHNHLLALKNQELVFENAFQGISRMILGSDIEKVVVNGRTTYDFKIFRQRKKHIIGMYDEINSFVSYVKDAAEGGSSKEMAYVLVGEPGNGKTFFVEYVSSLYREFLSQEGNQKFTFRFNGLDKIGTYGKIATIESQTYEDPAILAMNLFDSPEESRNYLGRKIGFSDEQLDELFENYRPLGACSGFIWSDLRNFYDGKMVEMLNNVIIIIYKGATPNKLMHMVVTAGARITKYLIFKRLRALGASARLVLGDELTGVKGGEVRPPGRLHGPHTGLVRNMATGKSLTLVNPHDGKYPGSGGESLIDGNRGTMDHADGVWQGFKEVDLKALIDLGEPVHLERITAGFLENQSARAFLPSMVEIALSRDGEEFEVVETLQTGSTAFSQSPRIRDFTVEVDSSVPVRYVRLTGLNVGTAPDWHPRAGQKVWIFADEIIVE